MAESVEAQLEAGTSESEEMYLITIATAIEDGHAEPIPMSLLAAELAVSAVSTNQMIKKLHGRGLVEYTPYKGVSLTEVGSRIASSTLRRRRLWGVFLANELGLSPSRADEVACDLEHITPPDVAEQLSTYLGNPASGPRGRSIPDDDAPFTIPSPVALSTVGAGDIRTVVGFEVAGAVAVFLQDQGITGGVRLSVIGVGLDGSRLVEVGDGCVQLAASVAAGVLVEER
jgi:DtxR family Mn-dependent transcriptional regulator